MKKTVATKNQILKHVALSLLAGFSLVFVSSAISAQGDKASSGAGIRTASVAAINFQGPVPSSGESQPVQQAITYFGGLVLVAFLVGAHARAVSRKKNEQM